MAKRPKGTVIKTPTGWAAVIDIPRKGSGRRRRRWRRAATEREAEELLEQMLAELAATGTVSDGRRTVKMAIAGFSENRKLNDHDRWALEVITDGLGRVRLANLTVQDCDDFLSACAKGDVDGRRPIGLDHLRRVRQRLVGVLRNEMRLGYVVKNVAEVAEVPDETAAPGPQEQRALSTTELDWLVIAGGGVRRAIVDLMGRNALRPLEVRTIGWEDLDLDGELLYIPKVKRATNAERTILLDRTTIVRLRWWRREQERQRRRVGSAWEAHDRIVTTGRGRPFDRYHLARTVRQLCGVAGVEPSVRPYELRHTAISHAADAGWSDWELADWAGTSVEMIQRVYRHRLRRVARIRPGTRPQEG